MCDRSDALHSARNGASTMIERSRLPERHLNHRLRRIQRRQHTPCSAAVTEDPVTVRNERIELLADELLIAALTTTSDLVGARSRATLALDRILERDPELRRLSQILSALFQARDAYAAGSADRAWRQAQASA